MEALFIGHAYTDVTFVTDYLPTGDEKHVGQDYAFGIGGNAVVAALTVAKLGAGVSLIAQSAPDRLSDVFLGRCAKNHIRAFTREVKRSSLSLVLPNDDKRAILRCRDLNYLEDFPKLDIKQYKALHVDGHMADAALHYAKQAREHGVLTSYDGGRIRKITPELLKYIDVAVVSEEFAGQMKMTPEEMISHLKQQGVKVAAVTLGSKGYIFDAGEGIIIVPALPVEKVVDSTGAGDIFHGGYIYSYLNNPTATWAEHFKFARAAATLAVQTLGAEASIPTLQNIQKTLQRS